MSNTSTTPDTSKKAKQVFIVGCPRSGTTLLASMLTSHQDIAVMGETHFIPILDNIGRLMPGKMMSKQRLTDLMMRNGRLALSGIGKEDLDEALGDDTTTTVAKGIHRLHEWYARKHNASLSGDKTPAYVLHIQRLSRLLPDSVFLHIIRDGRHVSHSLLSKDWGPTTYSGAAVFWQRHVQCGRKAGQALGPRRYCEVRYEDLIGNDEKELRRICTFFSLPYDDTMRSFQSSGEMFSQRNFNPSIHQRLTLGLKQNVPSLQDAEKHIVESLAGDTLTEFGYEVGGGAKSSLPGKISAHLNDVMNRVPINKQRIKTIMGLRGK